MLSARYGLLISQKTREHLLQWLRRAHPEIQADENHIPAAKPLREFFCKRKIYAMFELELVVLPGHTDRQGEDIDPKRMAFMFVRRVCHSNRKVWLPPREIPGVASDGTAGSLLVKCGLFISDWTVLHMPLDDPLASSWVTDPNASA
ncbi:unnamed protein product [Rhizoctonia solani]|uniref:Uncharacterized protein n=1 Tax=Rhizoctonia solani TaxID=456999 RepID=A0A8H3E7X9_9AGAM|nr:unnamed protein product [Rhizoctonia solani]